MFFRRNKATSNDNVPVADAPISVIAAATIIEGNIAAEGEIHIDGIVRGSVEAAVCVIGHDGVVEGKIMASEVVVRGHVNGPIYGIHVDLQAGAHVEGDVVNSSIAVQNGAHIHGSIWHSDNPLGDDGETGAEAAAPAQPYLGSPLWRQDDDTAYRPLKVIKPR